MFKHRDELLTFWGEKPPLPTYQECKSSRGLVFKKSTRGCLVADNKYLRIQTHSATVATGKERMAIKCRIDRKMRS